jgi:hypothetical protein
LVSIHGQNVGSPFAVVSSEGRLLVDAQISGNIVIGSVSAHVDSIYVQSGTMHISSGNVDVGQSGNWYITGSINVVSPQTIGSWTGLYLGSEVWNIGSVAITNQYLGSENWIKEIPIGSNYILDTNPVASNKFNYQTVIVYSGLDAAGSIYRNHSTGSWVQVLTYDGSGNVANVSAWSVV